MLLLLRHTTDVVSTLESKSVEPMLKSCPPSGSSRLDHALVWKAVTICGWLDSSWTECAKILVCEWLKIV